MLTLVEVSIIVPVYNVEEYLEECMDSLCNQTFEDIEIICINDGSSDNSLEILEKYAENDDRISIYSQENKGLSASRNVGMKKVNGKYVYFMDSDDVLELNAMEVLHDLAEEKALDLIIFKMINFYDGTGERFESEYYNMEFLKESVGEDVFSYDDVKEDIVKIVANAQSKLYKADLIRDMEFKEGCIFEDNPFLIEVILKAERIYFLNEFLYLKRVRKDSITSSNDERFVDIIPIANTIIDLTKKYGRYDELKHAVINKKIRRIFIRYDQIDEQYKQYFFERIKEDFNLRKDEYEDVLNENSSLLMKRFSRSMECETAKEFDMVKEITDMTKEMDSLNNTNRRLKFRYNKLKNYNTARIQFKNIGAESNRMEILEQSDEDMKAEVPERLCDAEGQVLLVHSDANSLDLKMKAIGDGLLKIDFKSRNMNLDNKERFLIYIDYTRISIDNRDYITQKTLVSFDDPFFIEKRVKDSQILDIHIEWKSFSKDSKYTNKYRALRKDYIAMEKDYNHVKNVNKMLYKQIGVMKSSTSWKVTKPIRYVGDIVKGNKK